MKRREMIKLLAGAGAGLALGGSFLWNAAGGEEALFLLTDRPRADLKDLGRVRDLRDFRASITPVTSAPQDLTLIRGGTLVDPVGAGSSEALRKLAARLRGRSRPGTMLLSLEPQGDRSDDRITFEYGGEIVERISTSGSYRQIEMPGDHGPTVFRLEEGELSVVSSSCRHELCRKMGERTDGRIICAPNRLVATLPGSAPSFDAMTG